MDWEDRAQKKRILIRSMVVLAAIAVGAGLVTNVIAQQARLQDPLYQCLPSDERPYQAYVTISVTVNNQQVEVPKGIGVSPDCLRPIHTHENDGVIHVAYEKPYDFSLGHFLWYWNFDISKYDAKVYVNGMDVSEKYLDTVLKDNTSIIIDFRSKDSGIV